MLARILCVSSVVVAQVATATLQQPILDDLTPKIHKIAIVGAGAAGSSVAYHVAKFANESELDTLLNITIFEANDYIGGRTTTVNALNDPRYPLELGGSIFVKINQILYNASQDFNLQTKSRGSESTGSAYDLGIWDGDAFVFTLSNDDNSSRLKGTLDGWLDIVKLFWKYGLSPIRLRSLQQSVIGRFLRLYDDVFPFKDLTAVAHEVDLLSITGVSGQDLLAKAGVGDKFSNEIIQASTRVNYAQNLPDFHGLETMVCMSTDGGMSVDGGNWQIFESMVERSGARIHLNTQVLSIETQQMSLDSMVHYRKESDSGVALSSDAFDTVILAAPYNVSALKVTPAPTWKPNEIDYVSLHVTLFSSPFRPDPTYFGLNQDQQDLIPDTVLTTLPSYIDPSFLGRGSDGVGPTDFWSFSTLQTINPTLDFYIPPSVQQGSIPAENLDLFADAKAPNWPRRAANGKQYLYKIFSPEPIEARFLIDLFGWHQHPALPETLRHHNRSSHSQNSSTSKDRPKKNPNPNTDTDTDTNTDKKTTNADAARNHTAITALPKELLPWTNEKRWNSYPYLSPRTDFDCFDIYDCKDYPAPLFPSPLSTSPSPSVPDSRSESEDDMVVAFDKTLWAGRLYYTSAIEAFISTMETSALSGRNVARLIIDELLRKRQEEA